MPRTLGNRPSKARNGWAKSGDGLENLCGSMGHFKFCGDGAPHFVAYVAGGFGSNFATTTRSTITTAPSAAQKT